MKVLQMAVGMIGTNCYLAYDEKTMEGVVIDPGDNAAEILQRAQEAGMKIQYVLLTHGHFDHILAVDEICEKTGAKLVIHEADSGMLADSAVKSSMRSFMVRRPYVQRQPDILVHDGSEIQVGNLTFRYLHTPGHTPGSCVIQAENCLFTGDTLFRGSCGRCDLPGGDYQAMLRSMKKLYNLSGDYQVLPGHEGISTLEKERQFNPYMMQANGR
jgi:hydroxyacylglutathione hydrolase